MWYLSSYAVLIQATQIRLALSRILEDEQKWRESAEVLCGIPLESGQKLVTKFTTVINFDAYEYNF